MITVGAFEAKTHLSALLEKIAHGEQVTITKHGVPVAKIVPISNAGGVDYSTVVDQIMAFQNEHTLEGLSVREMIDEGRR